MKDIFLFLMKNREKAVYYQSKEELIPLYGVKEIENPASIIPEIRKQDVYDVKTTIFYIFGKKVS
ncbi:hypothetical protein EfmAA242_12610 [Enterococcus faecium]|nr:hypothetical protein EfmAA242_12610 [Enterococcus faecium]